MPKQKNNKYDKYGKGNKGRKSGRKDRGSKKTSDDAEEVGVDGKPLKPESKYNKVEYYIRDKAILDQASQLSFQNFLGGTPIGDYEIPTIMRFFMNPTPGITYQAANPGLVHPKRSGINMASLKMFNLLSMHSGRNMIYAPQDVGTMILQEGQVYAMFSYIRRLFGAVNVWNQYNRMFPKAIIEAMGIDYEDFVNNYSDYRTRTNAIISSLNQIPLLMNCGYLEKSMTQYEYIFTDTESPLAQCYVYLPRTTWILDEQSYSGGTILSTTDVVPVTGTRTYADFMLRVLRPMVDALLTSSTFNLVYADLLNLASKVTSLKFVTMPFILEGIATIPVHNYEALLHIHNMTVLGQEPSFGTFDAGSGTTPKNDVYPIASDNMLVYNPGYDWNTVTASGSYITEDVILDSPVANPDAGTRLEMTRYKATYTQNSVTVGGTKYATYVIVPDYVCVIADIICDDVTTPEQFSTIVENTTYGTSYDTRMCKHTQFDWAPLVQTFANNMSFEDNTKRLHGELNYYTTVHRSYLEKLNVVVYLGLFEIQ